MKQNQNAKIARIWEIDALRGFLILSMLGYHLYKSVAEMCIYGGYNIDPVAYVNATDPLRFWFMIDEAGQVSYAAFPAFSVKYLQPLVGITFFLISGIATNFSRNSLRNSLRVLCGAVFVSLFTMLLVILTGDETRFIRFGVLHCYAACHLVYTFILEGSSNKLLLFTAAGSLVIGYFLKFFPIYSNSPLLVPFGIYEHNVSMRDYWPLFPMMGWFLIGIVFGRYVYSDKKTNFPECENVKCLRPLCFLGRCSGLIYCGHIVLYTAMFCGIGYIFNLY